MNTNPEAKRILCYGDSNTRWRVPSGMGVKRYTINERRTGILQSLLWQNFEIIEEWLGWRTTMFDDPRPELPLRNWLKTLPIILESHLPLDLVILMLGTTDTKEMMNLSPEETAEWMNKLIEVVKTYKVLEWHSSPKILVIVPPIVKEDTDFASKLFKWGTEKWNKLVELYEKLALNEDIGYLNPTIEIRVDWTEWVHIDMGSHKRLAEIVYAKVKEIFN